jgi:antitoxin component YwqK of YwqJK toxin-antitoxin module
MQNIVFFVAALYVTSCSEPDLADSDTFSEAIQEAVDLKSLERKFMYGMFYLWVDKTDKPFSGWAKSTSAQNRIKELGYLKNGRKEGLWVSWDDNETQKSEIYWTEDRMHGPFKIWHLNGEIKVIGQTTDGEVDGEWTEYYSSGLIANHSINRIGHLVEISVWKPDGSSCPQSRVTDGNGSFTRYLEDGRVEHVREFQNGVETTRTIFNHR